MPKKPKPEPIFGIVFVGSPSRRLIAFAASVAAILAALTQLFGQAP